MTKVIQPGTPVHIMSPEGKWLDITGLIEEVRIFRAMQIYYQTTYWKNGDQFSVMLHESQVQAQRECPKSKVSIGFRGEAGT